MMSFLTYITGFYSLYSSNFGTFWLKIEQFWPFEEISIFIYDFIVIWNMLLNVFLQ
jgi:hypothetical protein